jgi:TonB-dependent receptor
MEQYTAGAMRPNRLSFAVSLALASLVTGNAALAQTTPSDTPAASAADEPAKVLVVGTRASQQSAIDRKKNAATAIDSIVSEDVGSLPDRNIGEAISRMAGISLDRGDYGEGTSVAVRGNSADLTRVELDGQGVQSAGGADMGGSSGTNTSGRAVEFRQLSADLIKSVDVVKGSTADMTEGALGGGIRIQTRNGLDFKKQFISVRVGASQTSLNKKWTPDANLIFSDKYFGGRLGILVNASHSQMKNEAHSVQVSQSAQQGYLRLLDFDNSPEKTYTYQPQTVNTADSNATSPVVSYNLTGGGTFNFDSPLQIVTKSAAAQTKADCYAIYPNLTQQQLQSFAVSADRGRAQGARANELLSCLTQWNDYTPSNLRYFVKREDDKKQGIDLRADFKVNNQLTLYAKGSYNRRETETHQLTYNLGNIIVNPARTASPGYSGPAFTENSTTRVRTPVPGSGYYLYNHPTHGGNNTHWLGTIVNVNPASVVVDSKHHLTKYTISDGLATTDQLVDPVLSVSQYFQAGGTYKGRGLNIDFFVGDAKSDFRRAQRRMSYTTQYGQATLEVLPNGLWNYSFPANSTYEQSDPSQYGKLNPPVANINAVTINPGANTFSTRATPAYTVAQQPLTSASASPFYNPQIRETSERTAKLDLSYHTPDWMPLFTRIKAGFNLRNQTSKSWDPNGGNSNGTVLKAQVGTYGQPGYQLPVILPTPIIRSTYTACQDTAGSLGPGGKACQYGFNPWNDLRSARAGDMVVTPSQFQDLVRQTLTGNAATTSFFDGAKDRPANLLNNWTEIDVKKAFEIMGIPNMNYDCVKRCMANDGNYYDQPASLVKEKVDAMYLMGDFNIDSIPFTSRSLPFGLEIDGNIGVRYVRTRAFGTGLMTFTAHQITDAFVPARPNDAAGYVTSTVTQNTTVDGTSHDVLPSFNAAMWVIPDKVVVRYNAAKTVARPPVYQLLASGNCTYDERRSAVDPNVSHSCSGTLGNPHLQARENVNQNLSVEYYPNKDTMLTVSTFKQRGKVGQAISQSTDQPLFGGGDLVIPGTNLRVADLPFDYSTWQNGPVSTRKGWEFSGKTAFTFLPWYMRYTGIDLNYTRLKSLANPGALGIVDLLSGEPMPPQRESKYTYNVAVWYDDGRLQARLALQVADRSFTCIASCGQNSTIQAYPNAAGGRVALPYNPGSPNFKDATRFVDGKISYKVKPNIEVFAEGRNLGNATTSNSQGKYSPFAEGIPNILDYAYAGRRIMVGVNFRTM